MKNFEFVFPTRIIFKKGIFNSLEEFLAPFHGKFLLVTGQSYAEKNGLVDSLRGQLGKDRIVHFKGITPNPKVDEVIKGVEVAKKENVDVVIALGGGSVMDASKYIASLVVSGGDPWEYAVGRKKFKGSLPLITIPTVPASGSEANPFAVISNPGVKEKRGLFSPHFWPKLAIWDPLLTHSLPLRILKDSVIDVISHALEGYISGDLSFLQNGFTEVIIRNVMRAWERIKEGDKSAMDILCWASTLAISPFLSAGRGGHFVLHGIEHAVSGIYDKVTHGSGLAALMVPYLKVVGEKRPGRVSSLTKSLFDVYHFPTGIQEFELWMKRVDLFVKLKDLGVEDLDLIEQKTWETSSERLQSVDLGREELRRILELAYE